MTTFSFYSFRILKISPYINFKFFLASVYACTLWPLSTYGQSSAASSFLYVYIIEHNLMSYGKTWFIIINIYDSPGWGTVYVLHKTKKKHTQAYGFFLRDKIITSNMSLRLTTRLPVILSAIMRGSFAHRKVVKFNLFTMNSLYHEFPFLPFYIVLFFLMSFSLPFVNSVQVLPYIYFVDL